MLSKTCIVLTVFGALNWVLLGMFDTDIIVMALGAQRTVGTDMLRLVVAVAALYVLVVALRQ